MQNFGSAFQSINAGSAHTCGISKNGAAKCWGSNSEGQIGDGTFTDKTVPTAVSGLSSGVASIGGGGLHTCALTNSKSLFCWGQNLFGQMGTGSDSSSTPVEVSSLAGKVAWGAPGPIHTCAITTAGGAKCWGSNFYGQLGDGSKITRKTPVDVSGLTSGVASIAAAESHTCALTVTGGVKCWGSNSSGQLGSGTLSTTKPTDVLELSSGVAAIAVGGDHTCALTTAGAVKCWGAGADGQIGDNATDDRHSPVDVAGLSSGVVAISLGFSHSCALMNTGRVKCWGRNVNGQLGDGSSASKQLVPVDATP